MPISNKEGSQLCVGFSLFPRERFRFEILEEKHVGSGKFSRPKFSTGVGSVGSLGGHDQRHNRNHPRAVASLGTHRVMGPSLPVPLRRTEIRLNNDIGSCGVAD